MTQITSLACRQCGATTEPTAQAGCPSCGGPLDPAYDWAALRTSVDRLGVGLRERTIWRYAELLPLAGAPTTSLHVGWTRLIESPALADLIGVRKVWIKFDGGSFPSLSFKDRGVAVAINKAVELGMKTVGCASTGNLANAVAAQAAAAGLDAWIFVPDAVEASKAVGTLVHRPNVVRVHGSYDEVSHLSREAARSFGWGIVNANLRAFYTEGHKTIAFEIAEQLGWRVPDAVVVPMGSGALATKLHQGFEELGRLGWIDTPTPRIMGAQAVGCAPIATAVLNGADEITPCTPTTIATSIAIGDPADGPWAVRAMMSSDGWAAAVPEDEIADGIRMLAEFGGVFTEPAGGVAVAAAKHLAAESRLTADDEVVLCITGNGLKGVEALRGAFDDGPVIGSTLSDLERLL